MEPTKNPFISGGNLTKDILFIVTNPWKIADLKIKTYNVSTPYIDQAIELAKDKLEYDIKCDERNKAHGGCDYDLRIICVKRNDVADYTYSVDGSFDEFVEYRNYLQNQPINA